jgi:acyl-CoA synthetase (AMP-forming)/AMP-acid ligase II
MRLSSLASYGIFSAAAVVVLLNTMYLLDHQRTATSHVDFVRACVEDPEPVRRLFQEKEDVVQKLLSFCVCVDNKSEPDMSPL